MALPFVLRRCLIVGLLAALACSAAADGPKQLWAKSFLGQKAPALQVEKWLTPAPDTAGKFVLVDFWATWCPPCRAAIAELNELKAKFGDRLVVIGLSDEPERTVAGFQAAARQGKPEWVINYAIAIDTAKRTKTEVQVVGIPHVMIMDPQGIVRWEGFPFLANDRLTPEAVAKILASP